MQSNREKHAEDCSSLLSHTTTPQRAMKGKVHWAQRARCYIGIKIKYSGPLHSLKFTDCVVDFISYDAVAELEAYETDAQVFKEQ